MRFSLRLMPGISDRKLVPDWMIQTNNSIKIGVLSDSEELQHLIAKRNSPSDLQIIVFDHIQSVFSHLASSEDAKDDEFTKFQIDQFKKISTEIQKHATHKIMMHILNSAGINRFPDAQFDMVR